MADQAFSWRVLAGQAAITALISAGIVTVVIEFFIDASNFERDWKERSLVELVAPAVMHLDRTKRVAGRYRASPVSYSDAQLMRESNAQVRSVLLAKGDLLPPELRETAHRLVEHYDVWIQRFDEKVALENPTATTEFDVGFSPVPFPVGADTAFLEAYEALREELYDVP